MEPTNSTGKGYTDEQWDSLLCRTFGDPAPTPKAPEPPKPEPVVQTPPTPAPPAPPVPKQEVPVPETPKPETPEKVTPAPAKPAPKKKRKIWTLVWILLAVSLAVAIVAVLVFPREDDDTKTITKEQRQCMKALRQWQDAQYYQVSTSTNIIAPPSYSDISIPSTVSVYYHGDNCELSWVYTRYGITYDTAKVDQYVGQAKINGNQYTYSHGILAASCWNAAVKELEISQPWIMSFSLDDVQIIDQHTFKEGGDITVVSFSVMDLDSKDAYYDQGPYRVNFRFDKNGQLYSVMHYFSHYSTNHTTITTYNLTEYTAEYVEKCIKSQINDPIAYPGLAIKDTSVAD